VDDAEFERAAGLVLLATRAEIERLIRKLEDLRRNRGEWRHRMNSVAMHRQDGELNGLDMAISVLKGEL
jgi:uncharacterized membrane protein